MAFACMATVLPTYPSFPAFDVSQMAAEPRAKMLRIPEGSIVIRLLGPAVEYLAEWDDAQSRPRLIRHRRTFQDPSKKLFLKRAYPVLDISNGEVSIGEFGSTVYRFFDQYQVEKGVNPWDWITGCQFKISRTGVAKNTRYHVQYSQPIVLPPDERAIVEREGIPDISWNFWKIKDGLNADGIEFDNFLKRWNE